ncbi:hypothetical protein GW17_00053858 [Ensete ventricosum]|nr:hypothetical protein GW17_00053858 [Ensete ventricosum]RZS07918.1 hypothetical protein BHM03_00038825 [Ensete ventricosum]
MGRGQRAAVALVEVDSFCKSRSFAADALRVAVRVEVRQNADPASESCRWTVMRSEPLIERDSLFLSFDIDKIATVVKPYSRETKGGYRHEGQPWSVSALTEEEKEKPPN